MPVTNPFLQPVRSAVDYGNDYAMADQRRQAVQQGALGMQETRNKLAESQRVLAEQQGVRNALMPLGPDATDQDRINAMRATGTQTGYGMADALTTTIGNQQKSAASAAKDSADATKTTQGVQQTNYTQAMQKVLAFQSPADALASLNNAVTTGKIDMQHATMMARSIPQNDPAAFDAWKRQWAIGIADPAKMAELMKPHIDTFNTGGAQVTQAVDPVTMKPTMLSRTANTVSPDTMAREAGENARSAAQRTTQLKLGGYDANGNMVDLGLGGAPAATAGAGAAPAAPAAPGGAAPGAKPAAAAPVSPMAGLVDAIGQYKSPEGVALSRVPAGLKSQVLAAVQAKYPDYDPSTYSARQKAARDFGTGTQGNAMRSFAVANDHLDQLQQLAQAMNNGDVPLINKISNTFGVQTGQAPAAVFNAVRQIVGQEVVKAMVAGGGSAGEREHAAATFSSDSSPDQFMGTIGATRMLMKAQHDALKEQRRAAGLPDSTMPNYGSQQGPAAPAGAGAFKITHVDGKPQ